MLADQANLLYVDSVVLGDGAFNCFVGQGVRIFVFYLFFTGAIMSASKPK